MKKILFTLLLLFSASSYSVDLWYGGMNGIFSGKYPEKLNACQDWLDKSGWLATWPGSTVIVQPTWGSYGYCDITRPGASNQNFPLTPTSECSTGEVWDELNQICTTPVTCDPGQEISVTTDGSLAFDLCFGGCAYDFKGVGVYSDAAWSGKVVSTGQTCSASDSAPSNDIGPLDAPDNCITSNGNQLCDGAPNDNCGTYNGIETCTDTNDPQDKGCAYINGTRICPDDEKNCGIFNGKKVCVESNQPNQDKDGCVRDFNGKTVCLSDKTKQQVTETKTTNPDGSVTTLKTIMDNILGHGKSTTSTNTSSDGNTTSQTTTNQGEKPTGDKTAEGEDKEEEQEEKLNLGEKGTFDTAGQDTEINAAKDRVSSLITQIRTEAGDLFSFTSSTSANLPCWSVTIREKTYEVCLSDYSEQFAVLGRGILFISYLIGLGIMLRS